MISIKELSEVPVVKFCAVTYIISISIFPPFAWTYALDSELFTQLDFWKLAFLASGFGIVSSSVCVGLIVVFESFTDDFFGYDINRELAVNVSISKGFGVIFFSHWLLLFNYKIKIREAVSVNLLNVALLYFAYIVLGVATIILTHIVWILIFNKTHRKREAKQSIVSIEKDTDQ